MFGLGPWFLPGVFYLFASRLGGAMNFVPRGFVRSKRGIFCHRWLRSFEDVFCWKMLEVFKTIKHLFVQDLRKFWGMFLKKVGATGDGGAMQSVLIRTSLVRRSVYAVLREAYGSRKIAVVSVCGPSNSGKSALGCRNGGEPQDGQDVVMGFMMDLTEVLGKDYCMFFLLKLVWDGTRICDFVKRALCGLHSYGARFSSDFSTLKVKSSVATRDRFSLRLLLYFGTLYWLSFFRYTMQLLSFPKKYAIQHQQVFCFTFCLFSIASVSSCLAVSCCFLCSRTRKGLSTEPTLPGYLLNMLLGRQNDEPSFKVLQGWRGTLKR